MFGVASCDDEYCCDTGVSLAFAIEPPLDPPDDEPPPPLDEPVTVMVALNVLLLLSVMFKWSVPEETPRTVTDVDDCDAIVVQPVET